MSNWLQITLKKFFFVYFLITEKRQEIGRKGRKKREIRLQIEGYFRLLIY